MVIPCGYLNLADVPVPFVEPEDPGDPAIVVTTPVAITILRIGDKCNYISSTLLSLSS